MANLMTTPYKQECFIDVNGELTPVDLAVSNPIRGEMNCHCMVRATPFLIGEKPIYGDDPDQAVNLSFGLLRRLLGDALLLDDAWNLVSRRF